MPAVQSRGTELGFPNGGEVAVLAGPSWGCDPRPSWQVPSHSAIVRDPRTQALRVGGVIVALALGAQCENPASGWQQGIRADRPEPVVGPRAYPARGKFTTSAGQSRDTRPSW